MTPRLFPDDDSIPCTRWRIPSTALARLAGLKVTA